MQQEDLGTKIAAYIEARVLAKLDLLDKDQDKKRKESASEVINVEDELEYHTKKEEIKNKYLPANWLTDAAARAKQISLVTHAAKFTHTDAKSSSIYAAFSPSTAKEKTDCYLTTATLANWNTDVVGNAAALDVAKLLQLEHNGETLIDHIVRGDDSPLRPFASSETQLQEWLTGFQQVVAVKELSSHTLSKQIYFPINAVEYNLLSPLFASSLIHEFYQKITDHRFSDAAKSARKDKWQGKYSAHILIDYPNMAIQKFGGTKPQNVSQLNTLRRGRSFLLNCAPPTWQTRLQPPLKVKSIFLGEYDKRAWRQAKALQDYLEKINDKSSTKLRRDLRAYYVDNLIDLLINYAAEIQALTPGWSVDSKLDKAQQLWLDPYRQDLDFKNEREKDEWQPRIADEFALWLNRKVNNKKLPMGDSEHREWKHLVSDKLKLLERDLREYDL